LHQLLATWFNGMSPAAIFLSRLPFGPAKKSRAAHDILMDLCEKEIVQKQNNHSYNDGEVCYINTLLQLTENLNVRPLTFAFHFLSLIFAQHVNVPGVLFWTLCHVYNDKDILAKVRGEQEQSPLDATISDSVSKFDYRTSCFWEASRLYSNLLQLRYAEKDISIEGYHICKGSIVCVPNAYIYRKNSVVSDGDKYCPNNMQNNPYLISNLSSFGSGKHPCLGKKIATAFFLEIMTTITKNYEMKILGAFPQPNWVSNLGTPQPKGHVWVNLKPR